MINVNIKDLAAAYRKVKVDLWYSGNPCRLKLTKFEDNLKKNLQKILDAFQSSDEQYFLGISKGYWLCPKKISFKNDGNKDKKSFPSPIFSNPEKQFSVDNVEKFELRIVENLPIEFHIITTLWINKIGERFDKKLSDNAYGNRLRRHKDKTLNLQALGSFNSYLHYYQAWRDNGLKAIRNSLENNKNVVAITADFSAFYHNVDAEFIASSIFHEKLGIKLEKDDREFTELIIKMLSHWADNTPLKHGLPVGCSISAIVANMALALFDEAIEKEIAPLYYGRYVDDIILVLENTNNFSSSLDVWEWIRKRIDTLDFGKEDKSKIVYHHDKALNSALSESTTHELFFEQNKTKVFLLDSPSGLAFLDSLEHQIKERSSEWRSLPELPSDNHIASMLLTACNKTGEDADNLRKADVLSTRRAMFAMKLRDFESYCRNLQPDAWKKQRTAFLKTIDSYFTNLNCFFDMFRYFSRILSIATECGDYEFVISIATKIYKNCNLLSSKAYKVSGEDAKDPKKNYNLFMEYISWSFVESIIASVSFPLSEKINTIFQQCPWLKITETLDIKKLHQDFSGYDLALKPFRYYSFYKDFNWPFDRTGAWATFFYADPNNIPMFINSHDFIRLLWLTKHCIKNLDYPGIPQAWIFPTRPFNMAELYLCIINAFEHQAHIAAILCTIRGYAKQADKMPQKYVDKVKEQNKSNNIFNVQNENIGSQIRIALASWKTENSSWIAAANKENDPDSSRYYRLAHLLNCILRSHEKIDYVVFPELSIPPRWFLGLANKLKSSGISLIGGVEYIHDEKDIVHNQVWCSLLHKGLGFTQSVITRHDKNEPAIHEREELMNYANKTLIPENPDKICSIIQHGEFYFGILICSELTNIDYRAKFRGNVDAIIVPEWNSDTEMFGSLIEASAYDIHAFIVQCNDRQYGDTRIRIPAKKHHNRDIVRVKGGEEDFFVVGKLDIDRLRAFQSFNVSPTGNEAPFKPVPAGFKIAKYRKVLPEIIK